MIRIIDGLRYNTETAERLADISPIGYNPGDFRYEDTWLYVTRSGRFFIAGKGNAMSRWSRSYGQNGSCGGEGLRPLNKEEARELLEEHGSTEDIERLFPGIQDA